MNNRLRYFIIILIVIGCGILSRHIDCVPLCVGDMLYAVMVYFGFCFLLPKTNDRKIAIAALFFCFFIEIFQLYQPEWLTEIRKTPLGHYALGVGFLWSDLAAYTAGTAFAWCTDRLLIRKYFTSE